MEAIHPWYQSVDAFTSTTQEGVSWIVIFLQRRDPYVPYQLTRPVTPCDVTGFTL